jgi:hypothetical protein
MKKKFVLIAVLLAVPTIGTAGSPEDNPELKKLSVACPANYANVALNDLLMRKAASEFAKPYTNALATRKQGLWMKHGFNSGDWNEQGPTEGPRTPRVWSGCFKYKNATYAYFWNFQPRNSGNESIAIVDLDSNFVGLYTGGTLYLPKKKPKEVEFFMGESKRKEDIARTKITEEILQAIGYLSK